jgi:hypothetical protein
MTIRLLDHWNGFDANDIVTTDAATEAGLVAAKRATTDLTSGVVRYADVAAAGAVSSAQQQFMALKWQQRGTIDIPAGTMLRVDAADGGAPTIQLTSADGLQVLDRRLTPAPQSFGPFSIPMKAKISANGGPVAAYTVPKPSNFSPIVNDAIELNRTTDLALWPDRAQPAGCTWAISNEVLFDGHPTIELTIPAGVSGSARIGTTVEAPTNLPYNWDGKGMQVAIRSSNLSAVNGAIPYLAVDSGFAQFYTWDGENNLSSLPEPIYQPNDWIVLKPTTPNPGGGTSPGAFTTMGGRRRIRLAIPILSQPSETKVYIGFFGITPKRKPTLILSADDGYSVWGRYLIPQLLYAQVPCSFAIDYGLVGLNGYLTESELLSIHNHPSGLFELINHGYNNQGYNEAGAAKYVENAVNCMKWLHDHLGVNDGARHHAWVQSQYGDDVIKLMRAAGFYSCRATTNANQRGIDDRLFYTMQDKWRWCVPSAEQPRSGVTLQNVKDAITTALVTNRYGVTHLNLHSFGDVDASNPLQWSYDKLGDLLGWINEQRAAGTFEVKTMGQWWADITGTVYIK